ncbi:MAG: DUF4349 domain-containing protein [Microbacteriaceae bacterium]
MRQITKVSAVVIAVTLALAGCSANSSAMDRGEVAEQAPDSAGGDTGFESAPREVIVNGSVTVTVESPADAAADAARIAESSGGRVDARSERAPINDDKGSAELTLRLPSATLTTTLDKLKKLGDVVSVELTSSDVTTEVKDLDSRISALEASITRLHQLLKTAKDTADLIDLETAITERQGNLESMQSQQRALADQVSLATIEFRLISEAEAPVETPNTFWSGLQAGWGALVGFFSALLVVLGAALPWLVFLGLIAFGIVSFIRWRIRRSDAAAAARAMAAGVAPEASQPVAPAPVE